MALMQWQPFEGLPALRREMDRLFEDFSHGGGALRFWERAAVRRTSRSVTIPTRLPSFVTTGR